MRSLLFFFLLFTLAGCDQSEKTFDYGKIKNGVYKNDYFDFKIPIPQNWDVRNDEQMQQLQKNGGEVMSGNNKELAEKIAEADATAILLTVFKNKTDTTATEFNPSFIILSENIQGTPGVKMGKDYLDQAKYLMQQSKMPYHFAPDYSTEMIGNKEFDRMDVSFDGQAGNVQQSYYAILVNNFALSIIISYGDTKQKAELKGIINKIKFK